MDITAYAQFLLDFIFVLGLIGLCAVALRKFGGSITGIRPTIGTRKRLNLVEILPIDAKRRLILVRRDDKEHLVLLGMHGDCIVESGIPIPSEVLEAEDRGKTGPHSGNMPINPMDAFKNMVRRNQGKTATNADKDGKVVGDDA